MEELEENWSSCGRWGNHFWVGYSSRQRVPGVWHGAGLVSVEQLRSKHGPFVICCLLTLPVGQIEMKIRSAQEPIRECDVKQRKCCSCFFLIKHKTLFLVLTAELFLESNFYLPISASSGGTAERRGLWLCCGFPPTWQQHLDSDGARNTWRIQIYLQKRQHRTSISVRSESGCLQQHGRRAFQSRCHSVFCRRRYVHLYNYAVMRL